MDNSIDKQFVEYIIKSLVGNPDAVKIERRIDEKGVLLELSVDPEDLGRVIGKGGATAQSIRTLLRALGTKNDARYNLKIIDNGPPRDGYNRPPASNGQSDDSQANNPVAQDDSSTQTDISSQTDSMASKPQPESEENKSATTATEETVTKDDSDNNVPENEPTDDEVSVPKSADAWSTKPENDSEDAGDKVEEPAKDESVVSKTRKELEDLDDLDV